MNEWMNECLTIPWMFNYYIGYWVNIWNRCILYIIPFKTIHSLSGIELTSARHLHHWSELHALLITHIRTYHTLKASPWVPADSVVTCDTTHSLPGIELTSARHVHHWSELHALLITHIRTYHTLKASPRVPADSVVTCDTTHSLPGIKLTSARQVHHWSELHALLITHIRTYHTLKASPWVPADKVVTCETMHSLWGIELTSARHVHHWTASTAYHTIRTYHTLKASPWVPADSVVTCESSTSCTNIVFS